MEVSKAYGVISGIYDFMYFRPVHKFEDNIVKSMIQIGKDESVIDIGCGTGNLLNHIEISPDRYLGIDISPEMVMEAKKKHPAHEFRIMDMDHMPDEFDGKFDVAISLFGSFSYSYNPFHTAQKIKKILSKRGRIFIMLYGIKTKTRRSYTFNRFCLDIERFHYTVETASAVFREFNDLKLTGLNFIGDIIPGWLLGIYFKVERALNGMIADRCCYLIVEGKNASQNNEH